MFAYEPCRCPIYNGHGSGEAEDDLSMGREYQNETKNYRVDCVWSDGYISEGEIQPRFAFPLRRTKPCVSEVVDGE